MSQTMKKRTKRSANKTPEKSPPKRDLFAEISKGLSALADARTGKRTLRTNVHTLENCEQSRAKPDTRQPCSNGAYGTGSMSRTSSEATRYTSSG